MTADQDGQTALQPNGESTTAQAADAPRDDAAPSGEAADAADAESNGQADPPAVEEAVAEAPAAAAAADDPAGGAQAPDATQPAGAEPRAAAEQPAAQATAPSQPAADAPAETAAEAPPAPVTPDAERPAVGPRILGVAAEPKPLPTVKATLPTRKRRRRPSAAERHRRAFFSALTDLRRGGTMPTATPAQDAASAPESAPAEAEAAAAEPPVEPAPAAEQPAPEQQPAAQEQPAASGADRSPTSPARVTAAIERVGGAEIIKEALKPKQDEKGQPLKWAAVCAQSAEGMKPGDPVFNAWVRLAATPVREVKALLPRPPEAERSERGPGPGRRPGGRAGGGRPRRDDRPNRSEYASHAQDGTLRKSIRIVTGHDEDQERRERERNRKEQREAKRRAERERLARLGY